MPIDAFEQYLSLEKKYSPHTVHAYRSDLQSFYDFCSEEDGPFELKEVGYPIIRSWIISLSDQGISNRSINRKVASLRAFFRFLQKIGDIDQNPLAKHRALKTPKKLEVPFSEEEVHVVLGEMEFEDDFEGMRDRLIIELFYATGIRRAELIGLQMANLDLGGGVIKVLGKRNKERIIPLLPSLKVLFKDYFEQRNMLAEIHDRGYVFLTGAGYKLYETLVYRIINKYFSIVSTKVKKSPHILRHTFATHLLNKGADLNSVKELLGHASLASTQVYTHNGIAELKKTHDRAHPRSKE